MSLCYFLSTWPAFGIQMYTDYLDLSRVVTTLKDPLEANAKGTLGITDEDGDSAAAHHESEEVNEEQEKKEDNVKKPELPPRLMAFLSRYKALHSAMAELIEDFSLVGFLTLNVSETCLNVLTLDPHTASQIEDKESLANVIKAIDKSNGYMLSQ